LSGGAYRNSAASLAGPSAATAALPQRLLNLVLFVTVLSNSIAFIEPSPHDALMMALLVACIAARVPFDHKLAPLLVLLTIWFVGGCMSLIQVGDQEKPVQYIATSLYLDIAALTFACLFSDGDGRRLSILKRAYILSALIATATGFIGFFHLLPGSDAFLTYDRVSATFKDPNVYGPFLIFPLVLLVIDLATRGFRLLDVAIVATLLGGLFLSFSRGAWGHFAASAAIAMVLVLAASPEPRMRRRIVTFVLIALIAAALLTAAFMSIDSVHQMFVERARAIQPYDVGPGGRFGHQELALSVILDHPFGIGPFEFDRLFGEQQHNVYMQGMLVYGWLGGAAYLALIVLTLLVGLRTVLIAAPWQYFLIAAYATFVGEAFEGMIVDTDHWRHFYLALGLVWGLSVATINFRRRQRARAGIEDDGLLVAAAR
jgi:hypothetical protein